LLNKNIREGSGKISWTPQTIASQSESLSHSSAVSFSKFNSAPSGIMKPVGFDRGLPFSTHSKVNAGQTTKRGPKKKWVKLSTILLLVKDSTPCQGFQ
jgi:hypothetical protein